MGEQLPMPSVTDGRRPRVAVVIPTLQGAGCERVVADLLPDLCARYAVELVLYEPAIAYPVPPGLPLRLLHSTIAAERPGAVKGLRFGVRVARLAAVLRRGRYDAVLSFVDTNNLVSFFAHRLTRRRARLVLVEQTVGAEFFHFNPYARRYAAVYRPLLGLAYRHADAVIVVSRAMGRYLRRALGVRRPLTVIYNGVDVGRFYPPAPGAGPPTALEPAYRTPGVRLLSVGRLDANKDQAFLVRVLPHVLQHVPDARLYLIGVGPNETALREQAARLGLAARVGLLGWKTNVADYMRFADALLLASHHESFGNVLVEALACGLPVVATRATAAFDEILGGGRYGAIVPCHDEAAYAAAVVATLRHRSADPAYRAALARYARTTFDQRTTNRRYLDVLARVLGT
jgi:glycosyltransferase involved in cell wall biosynthesis